MVAVKKAKRKAADLERQTKLGDFAVGVLRKSLNVKTGAAGGYTVPPQLLLGVDRILNEECIFHELAWNVEMTSDELQVPLADIAANHVTGESPLFGGMQFKWQNEDQAVNEGLDAKFAAVGLRTRNCEGLAVVANQLLEDGGPQFGLYFEKLLAECLGWTVERSCFKGSSAGEPLGILAGPGLATVSRATGNQVKTADIAGMIGAIVPACIKRAVWAVNPSTLPFITALSTFIVNRKGMHLMGRPLFITEKLPVLGTTGDVLLFDPAMYVLGTRSVEIALSPHPSFLSNQTNVRVVWRGDGQPLARNTFTIADDTTTCGCYVALHS